MRLFIPVINSLFAVGLVALPGMMTGQILSGVSPVTAAHYQIVVMCMIFGSTGLSTAYFLVLSKTLFTNLIAKTKKNSKLVALNCFINNLIVCCNILIKKLIY